MRQAGRIDRRALGWLTRRVWARRTAEPPGPGGPGRILVVRVDERVGNLVMLQSLLDALGQGLPGVELGLWAAARQARLARSLEGVARLHLIDRRWFLRDGPRWRAAVEEVRGQAYPVALDASAWHEFSFTHAALTYFSGAPWRLGFARSGAAGFLTHPVPPGPAGEHELAQRVRLLAPLGLGGRPAPVLRSSLGADLAPRSRRWLAELQVGSPRVGLWLGSRKRARRWPLPYFVQLGRRLQQQHAAALVLLWGPGEEALRDEAAAALREGVVCAPATDLEALAGLLRALDLLVTNDTGPMHLAVAVGCPTVALFTAPEASRWGHPVAHARNLVLPGQQPGELDQALAACAELLGAGRG
ncbi:MAG TPA: glycosyltransferase family 9 protein [Myxococcota bacterium]|nr:glycosyltransferase family 9 protein [Myxococcota bacterium]HRY97365.1 glycosyltransferase family 9 protein [Myxococcota bacterium]HSA24856.1 glycosyltransferase family 9 protein [Myxococcota bacterium]